VAIPSSVFYGAGQSGVERAGDEPGRTLVRWAFCKRDEVLRDALVRLGSWAS
jgi:N-succinyldiaminopimelate aminotransferase